MPRWAACKNYGIQQRFTGEADHRNWFGEIWPRNKG